MHAILLGVTWGMIGLDSGWKALPSGGIEYILQIAPQELEIFKQDKNIEVDIPAKLREVHSIRVVVGSDVLPREDPVKAPATLANTPAPLGKTSASPAFPDFSAPFPLPGVKQNRPSGYQPLSALMSFWDRYPFPRSASEPADPAPSRTDDSGSRKTPSNRRASERPSEDDLPATRDDAWGRSQGFSRSENRTDEKDRDRISITPSRETPKQQPESSGSYMAVVLVLLGSLGGNIYMGWITWETRTRYHALVRRRKKSEYPETDDEYSHSEE